MGIRAVEVRRERGTEGKARERGEGKEREIEGIDDKIGELLAVFSIFPFLSLEWKDR